MLGSFTYPFNCDISDESNASCWLRIMHYQYIEEDLWTVNTGTYLAW